MMFKQLIKVDKRKSINIAILFCLGVLFFLFSFLRILNNNNIFPILNGIIFLISLFISKGRYRAYAMAFYIPLGKLMLISEWGIGSFATWILIIYFFITLFERIVKHNSFDNKEKRIFLCFICLSLFLLLTDLININSISIKQYVSIFAYISIPFSLLIDKQANKKIEILIFCFALSQILANAFCFLFLYIAKTYALSFLEIHIPTYVSYYTSESLLEFRLPGLLGDSNHNAYYILFTTSLIIIYLFKFRKHYVSMISMAIIIQFFAFLGGSKTYFIILLFIIVFSIFFFFWKTKNFSIILIFSLLVSLLFFIVSLNNSAISKVILRFLNIDLRESFLESITTSRASIWANYLIAMIKDPFKLLIGHGTETVKLFEQDYHSIYIQSLWEIGLIGTLLYIIYFGNFLFSNFEKKPKLYYLPILTILLFGITLHALFEEGIFIGIFIYLLIIESKDIIIKKDLSKITASKLEETKKNYEIDI